MYNNFNTYGLPLALIFEEILDLEWERDKKKPSDTETKEESTTL